MKYFPLNKIFIFVIVFIVLTQSAYCQCIGVNDTTNIQLKIQEYQSYYLKGQAQDHIDSIFVLKNVMLSRKHTHYYLLLANILYSVYYENDDIKRQNDILYEVESYLKEHNLIKSKFYKYYLYNKGLTYIGLFDYGKAIISLEQSRKNFEQEDEINAYYISVLNHLALCYIDTGNVEYAKMILEYALSIYKSVRDDDHIIMLLKSQVLNKLISIYINNKDYTIAEDLLVNLLASISNEEEQLPFKTILLSDYAELEVLRGNYQKADSIFSLINTENLSKKLELSMNLKKITLDYFIESKDIIKNLKRLNSLLKSEIINSFSILSYDERESLWDVYSRLMLLMSNAFSYKFNHKSFNIESYNNILFTKKVSLDFNPFIKDFTDKSDNSFIKQDYKRFIYLDSKILFESINQTTINQLINERNMLERKILSRLNSEFKEFTKNIPVWKDVKNSLNKNEVALEFTIIPEFSITQIDNPTLYYGAFLTRKEYEAPILVTLCKCSELEDILGKGTFNPEFCNYLYNTSSTLYNLLVEKLMPFLHLNETVYYSPCYKINFINLDAIKVGSSYLSDIFRLKRVSSTSKISEIKKTKNYNQPHSAYLAGGMIYDLPYEQMRTESFKYPEGRISILDTIHLSQSDRSKWGFLPGTLKEIHTIKDILKQKDFNLDVKLGPTASEESFKALDCNSPDIIHLATHAYFIKDPFNTKNSYLLNFNRTRNKENKMIYNGLLFSGALTYARQPEDKKCIDDGILTAKEISHLNLSNTALTILSACDTGLGSVDIVDGVLGLQRAFKEAGVKTIITSLWKVDDKVTSIYMTLFYKYICKGLTPFEAFHQTISHIKKRYSNPYYWAGFTLLD